MFRVFRSLFFLCVIHFTWADALLQYSFHPSPLTRVSLLHHQDYLCAALPCPSLSSPLSSQWKSRASCSWYLYSTLTFQFYWRGELLHAPCCLFVFPLIVLLRLLLRQTECHLVISGSVVLRHAWRSLRGGLKVVRVVFILGREISREW